MRSDRRGIALLEVMVAVAIVSLAAVAAMAAASAELRTAQRAVHVLEVNALAEMTLAMVNVDPRSRAADGYVRFAPPFAAYEWNVTVQHDALPRLDLVSVTVRGQSVTRVLRSSRITSEGPP